MPFRKPLWRSTPTETPGARSIVTMFAFLPANFALAQEPISSPAFMLSVANSALAASCGSVGVSSAMTVTPWPRAFLIAGTMAFESAGVIRMPLAPRVTMFSIAVIWLWTSVSNLPDAVVSWALFAAAAFCAASFILTKNGFVSVFVIRPTWTLSPPPPPELLPLLLLLLLSRPPHATTPNAAMGTAAASAAKRDLRIPLMRFSPLKTPDPGDPDNVSSNLQTIAHLVKGTFSSPRGALYGSPWV